jgi:hypothetical protein
MEKSVTNTGADKELTAVSASKFVLSTKSEIYKLRKRGKITGSRDFVISWCRFIVFCSEKVKGKNKADAFIVLFYIRKK